MNQSLQQSLVKAIHELHPSACDPVLVNIGSEGMQGVTVTYELTPAVLKRWAELAAWGEQYHQTGCIGSGGKG